MASYTAQTRETHKRHNRALRRVCEHSCRGRLAANPRKKQSMEEKARQQGRVVGVMPVKWENTVTKSGVKA